MIHTQWVEMEEMGILVNGVGKTKNKIKPGEIWKKETKYTHKNMKIDIWDKWCYTSLENKLSINSDRKNWLVMYKISASWIIAHVKINFRWINYLILKFKTLIISVK